VSIISVILMTRDQIPCKSDVRFAVAPIWFVGLRDLFMLFVFIYVYWCTTRFPYQLMFVSYSNTTGVTSGIESVKPSGASEFTSGF